MKFGIIPELIGRMPMIATLRSLTREDLIRVLTEPKNALTKQYQAMLRYDDVELVFEDDALGAIADQAVAKEIGARGLRSVMENLMLNIMACPSLITSHTTYIIVCYHTRPHNVSPCIIIITIF